MWRTALVGVMLLLGGCEGLVGPRQRRCQPVRVDNPCLTIPEQQKLGRANLALPEQSPNVAPRTDAEQPGYHTRPD